MEKMRLESCDKGNGEKNKVRKGVIEPSSGASVTCKLKVHYPTEFLLVGFGDGLALGVGSLAQNVDDDLFIRTESFHGSSPV